MREGLLAASSRFIIGLSTIQLRLHTDFDSSATSASGSSTSYASQADVGMLLNTIVLLGSFDALIFWRHIIVSHVSNQQKVTGTLRYSATRPFRIIVQSVAAVMACIWIMST